MIALPESQWKVTDELVKEFEELKEYLESHIQLSPIQVGEPLQLYTDASIEGLSFLLTQEQKITVNEKERTVRDFVHLGSTSLTDAQRRYSPVELEALALSWAVNKCHYFLYEAPFIDHFTNSTGVAGLMKKDLCEVRNPRLQCILEKVVSYNIISHHIPATRNGFSDYFSRFPSTGLCTALE